MKRRRILQITLLIALPGALIVGICWMGQRAANSRIGPLHTSAISPPPPFLTEELALSKARETLKLDGYDPAIWQPHPDDRSKAPDGTPDKYLTRNAYDPNRCQFFFTDATMTHPNPQRIVTVELKGDRLECRVIIPK